MKNKIISIISVIISVCMFVSCFSACGKKTSVTDSANAGGDVAETSQGDDISQSSSAPAETKKGETTTKKGETTKKDESTHKGETTRATQGKVKSTDISKKSSSSKKNISLTAGLNSTDVSEVLAYYKLVAKKNANIKAKSNLSLVSLDVGTLVIDGMSDSPNREKGLSYFEKGAEFALNHAGDTVPFPGRPSAITESDWSSAKAVNDGKYTTVTVSVKTQTDSYDGKEYEGSVGRSMQVLSGFDTAIDSINKFPIITMTADFKHSDVKIEYQNPTIKIKVLNSTGELVKDNCKWSYRTKIYLNKLDGTMKVAKNHTVTIKNSSGAVDYSVNY